MADFPVRDTADKNDAKPSLGGVTIDGPNYAENTGNTKTAQAVFVEQQWRDLEGSETAKLHPLSLNRDSSYVTDDPYTP